MRFASYLNSRYINPLHVFITDSLSANYCIVSQVHVPIAIHLSARN